MPGSANSGAASVSQCIGAARGGSDISATNGIHHIPLPTRDRSSAARGSCPSPVENLWNRAMVAGDYDSVLELYADDAVVSPNNAPWNACSVVPWSSIREADAGGPSSR